MRPFAAASIVALLLCGANARGDKIPGGLDIRAKDGRLVVARGSLVATLAYRPGLQSELHAVSTSDGVKVPIDWGCGTQDTLRFSNAVLDARLEYAAALRLAKDKHWDEAAAGFRRALAGDPGWHAAELELAAALVAAGKTDEAVAALAESRKAGPVGNYADLLLDSRLTPLTAAAEVASLRPATAGDARLTVKVGEWIQADLGKAGVVVSTALGLAAMVGAVNACPIDEEQAWDEALVVFRLSDGKQVAALPLVSPLDSPGEDKPITKAARKAVAARVEIANRFLTDLGFAAPSPDSFEVGEVDRDLEHDMSFVRFHGSGTWLALGDGGVLRLRDRGGILAEGNSDGELGWGVFLPAAHAALFSWGVRSGNHDCTCSMMPSGTGLLLAH